MFKDKCIKCGKTEFSIFDSPRRIAGKNYCSMECCKGIKGETSIIPKQKPILKNWLKKSIKKHKRWTDLYEIAMQHMKCILPTDINDLQVSLSILENTIQECLKSGESPEKIAIHASLVYQSIKLEKYDKLLVDAHKLLQYMNNDEFKVRHILWIWMHTQNKTTTMLEALHDVLLNYQGSFLNFISLCQQIQQRAPEDIELMIKLVADTEYGKNVRYMLNVYGDWNDEEKSIGYLNEVSTDRFHAAIKCELYLHVLCRWRPTDQDMIDKFKKHFFQVFGYYMGPLVELYQFASSSNDRSIIDKGQALAMKLIYELGIRKKCADYILSSSTAFTKTEISKLCNEMNELHDNTEIHVPCRITVDDNLSPQQQKNDTPQQEVEKEEKSLNI